MELTHFSLFSGIGGFDLVAEWAGFKTILFVEIDPYCQKVLRKHWPDVPIIGDIKDATKERIMAYASSRQPGKPKTRNRGQDTSRGSEKGSTDRRNRYQPVTLITGGFPCQPVSQAGQRRGKEDDRWLWPEMLRVISEIRPAWVVAENVTGLLTMGFYDCLSDLEGKGYETIPFVIPACGVNAPHRRDRIFIVANSKCQRWGGRHNGDEGGGRWSLQTEGPSAGDKQEDVADSQGSRIRQELGGVAGKLLPKDRTSQEFESSSGDVTDPKEQGLSVRIPYTRSSEEGVAGSQQGDWWAVEPNVGRVAHGIPNRVDRLKCLGNAVVPQVAYQILRAIADIETGG